MACVPETVLDIIFSQFKVHHCVRGPFRQNIYLHGPTSAAMMPEPMGDEARSQGRTRRRAVACRACRHKKLKCDLEYPLCGSCTRSKRSSQCIYDNGIPSRPLKSTAVSRRGNLTADSSHAGHLDSDKPRVMLSTVQLPKSRQQFVQWSSNEPSLVEESRSRVPRDAAVDREIFHSSKPQPLGIKTIVKDNVVRYRGNGIVANLLLQVDIPNF